MLFLIFADSSLDKIPTKELPLNRNNCEIGDRTDIRKTIVIDNKNNDTKEKHLLPSSTSLLSDENAVNKDRLSVSSVASITQIAELLGDMSVNMSPRLIIDKMLSAGKHLMFSLCFYS